jgi:hypothetical protein
MRSRKKKKFMKHLGPTCCSAVGASVFDLHGTQQSEDAMVDDKEEVMVAGGGSGAEEEKGKDLTEPGGCRIGIAPWTEISRDDINVVGSLGTTGESMGLVRGMTLSVSIMRA